MSLGASPTCLLKAFGCRVTRCGSIRQKPFANWDSRRILSKARLNARSVGFEKMATPNSETSPILVVAALGRELASLNREAIDGVTLLETGEGADNARRSLDDWLEQNTARAIVSIGFAGALSSALQAGALV